MKPNENLDPLVIGGKSYGSRLLIGTGKYKDFAETRAAVEASGAQIVTVIDRHFRPPVSTAGLRLRTCESSHVSRKIDACSGVIVVSVSNTLDGVAPSP
jgi:hypothetical protein